MKLSVGSSVCCSQVSGLYNKVLSLSSFMSWVVCSETAVSPDAVGELGLVDLEHL